MTMTIIHLHRPPALSSFQTEGLLHSVKKQVSPNIRGIETEFCFNIATASPLTADEKRLLRWLLAETFEPEKFSDKSFLTLNPELRTRNLILEVGPRMNFTTAWSTNAVSVCHSCGLKMISRI